MHGVARIRYHFRYQSPVTPAERDRKVDELRAIESRLRSLGEFFCAYHVRHSIALVYARYAAEHPLAHSPGTASLKVVA